MLKYFVKKTEFSVGFLLLGFSRKKIGTITHTEYYWIVLPAGKNTNRHASRNVSTSACETIWLCCVTSFSDIICYVVFDARKPALFIHIYPHAKIHSISYEAQDKLRTRSFFIQTTSTNYNSNHLGFFIAFF